MSSHDIKSAHRPEPDAALTAIADYARDFSIASDAAYETARYCLMDTLACGFQALKYPACRKLLGPVVPGAVMSGGARVPGTSFELDPVQAAFNIGAMVRWLDFNDTWLAAEWGHPSDNLGGILAVADYLARSAVMAGKTPPTVRDVLTAMIKAHEIQGVLALENSFNRVGLDHVLLVRVASTAVVTAMLGGTREQVINAVSNAWIDGGALRTYRHAPNTGSRKSWAAGDATSRAVRLALIALTGEMGYPSALSAKTWGFSDVLFKGKPLSPAAALRQLRDGERAVQDLLPGRVPRADRGGGGDDAAPAGDGAHRGHRAHRHRDPGAGRAHHRQDRPAGQPRRPRPLHPVHGGDAADLRAPHRLRTTRTRSRRIRASTPCAPRCRCARTPTFTSEYYAPDKRYIGNAVQVFFKDGTHTERIQVDFPIGHRKRRTEGMPVLVEKFQSSVDAHFQPKQAERIKALFAKSAAVDAMPVNELVAELVTNGPA